MPNTTQGNFVPVNPAASPQAAMLTRYISAMQTVLQIQPILLGVLNDMLAGGSNFTAIETMFGLPTGSGQTVFNMVNGSSGAMNGTMTNSQCVNVAEQMG